jgi:molybdopterin molybdotransferase
MMEDASLADVNSISNHKPCSEIGSKAHSAPINYEEALNRIKSVAKQHLGLLGAVGNTQIEAPVDHQNRAPIDHEVSPKTEAGAVTLPLVAALGKRSAQDIAAPYSIPTHDTSAMDGFAVSSASTAAASKTNPIRFRISHVIAAGDGLDTPIQSKVATEGIKNHGTHIHGECIEIMTGARFPVLSHPELDAVVKIEDVVVKRDSNDCDCCSAYIEVSVPVKKHQNRRFAGSDLAAGAPILGAGETVEPKHIMGLASVGYRDVRVVIVDKREESSQPDSPIPTARIKIGVLSTGSELSDVYEHPSDRRSRAHVVSTQTIPNSNGPYIVSSLLHMTTSVDVQYLGIAQDSEDALEAKLRFSLEDSQMDIIIATGGVSRGKFDLVRPVLEQRLQAKVVFHGVKVRPGLPVLFAVLERDRGVPGGSQKRTTAFFGLPGNPIATAMALRFFVVPYLAALGHADIRGFSCQSAIRLQRKRVPGPYHSPLQGIEARSKPTHLTCFWLSRTRLPSKSQLQAEPEIEILDDQASYKMASLLQANCWTEVPAGVESVSEGDKLIVHRLS